MKYKALVGAAAALVAAGLVVAGLLSPPAQADTTLFDERVPTMTTDPDTNSVELGVRFSSNVDGQVIGIRFYKSAQNTGTHTGSLWTSRGRRLAAVTFTGESASGWQKASFDQPVQIRAGGRYIASYVAPSGRYAADQHAFDTSYTKGQLTVPAGGGVYRYGTGGFPDQNWRNSNYYVDIIFVPGNGPTAGLPLSQSATASPTQGSTQTQSPTQTASAPAADPSAELALPRVPWEGGPAYYAQFPQSKAFTSPDVFPIAAWWADFDSDANVKWDKDHGVNTYVELNHTEDGSLLGKNGMYWIDDEPLRNMTASDPAWVGHWLSDETDGRTDPLAGQARIQREIDAQKGPYCPNTSCRFAYANYTTIVTSDYNATQIAADEKYVNMFDGPVSVDGYYYTDPHCDVSKSQYVDYAHNAPDYEHCETAAAYGNLIKTLRLRDNADGELKPHWGFVENGAPNDRNGKYITPDKMKGAAWNIVINEARGLVWFNQSFSGNCVTGNVIRTAEANPNGCNKDRVEAMKTVNRQIQSFAPILNTQSYKWSFGTGLDTMLKVKDGNAYVFAMIGLNADPGQRTFTLPAGIRGASVEVLGENRTIPVTDGKFTDTFAADYTTHIYRIGLK